MKVSIKEVLTSIAQLVSKAVVVFSCNFTETVVMGLVYAKIDLINGEDIALARRHVIGEEEKKNAGNDFSR